MKQQVFIIGAGGVGREVLAVLQHTSLDDQFAVSGFIDDGIQAQTSINGIPVAGGIDYLLQMKEANVIIAIGNPKIRRQILEKLSEKSFNFPSVIHPKVSFHDVSRIKMGKGVFITEGCILTTEISIGDFCFFNIGVTINHDAIIQENCVIMPGVRITCGVNLGSDSYVSANCVLSKPIEIPSKSWITASI